MNALPPRSTVFRSVDDAEFDVAVIGGGITGAGVARDAARRGFRTVLVERNDFAAGTSSRSSRLVHGGVRYLEHGWFHLVFEASRERRRLLDNAPHLVRPLQFTWPVYEDQRLARWQIGAGLLAYDVLALFRNVGKHKRLATGDVTAREPGLLAPGLKGGAAYWDAATDDARLTLATAIDAERAGAVLLTHAEVTGLGQSGGRADAILVRDTESGASVRIRARTIVNATGPWTDAVRRYEDPDAPAAVRGTKGVHLLVPRARLGNTGAVTLLHPADQRICFALPAGTHAIIGTTDTRTDMSADDVHADASDIAYLLTLANHYFPRASLAPSDVVSAWAGIRPLIATAAEEATTADQPREHDIAVGPHGVIAVSGGKLTTHRSMAEEIVDVVAKELGRKQAKSDTARAHLPGGDLGNVQEEVGSATDTIGDIDVATRLVHAHGSEWKQVWKLGAKHASLRERIVPTSDAIRAELMHAVRHEHARTIGDLLIRRTHVAFESRDHGARVAPDVAKLIAPVLGWDAARQAAEVARYTSDVARMFAIE